MTMHRPQSEAKKLERRNRELSILSAIAQALNAEVDLRRALDTALAQTLELFDLQTGWVWLSDEVTGVSYVAAERHLPPALADHPARMNGRAYCYCIDEFEDGTLTAENVSIMTCSRLKGLRDGTDGLRSHASIAIYAQGKPVGILNVLSADWAALSKEDLQLLHTVGEMIGIAVERARLFSRSTQLGATEERNRLAREIHDTLAQGLTAITLKLESADALLDMTETDPDAAERAKQYVRQALALTRFNLEEARRSVMDLRAAPLEGSTLAQAVEGLARDAAAKNDFELNLVLAGDVEMTLPLRVEAGLFRVAQEALTNIVNHAEAGHVTVMLNISAKSVVLTIEDDGRGFDTEDVPGRCFGLIGINERIRLLGGSMVLCSAPGDGTTIEVTVPL